MQFKVNKICLLLNCLIFGGAYNSALNFYIQKHKQEKDTTKLQIQFLKANKIQFLEMAKNYKIPSEINEIIDTMVINERNGVKFAKIKKEHYNKY